MPMPLTDSQKYKSNSTNDTTLVFFVSIAFALIPSSFITLIIREREVIKSFINFYYIFYYKSNYLYKFTLEQCKTSTNYKWNFSYGLLGVKFHI